MTTNLAGPADERATIRPARHLGRLVPAAAGLLYAGVQLDGGITAAAFRGVSTVSDQRLNFPFSGSLATATSLTWGLSQALFVVTLLAVARSDAFGSSRSGRIGARLAVVGGIVLVAAHGVSVVFRDASVHDAGGVTAITLFAIASLLSAVGLTVAGVAVVRAGRWSAWRRYPVLGVGIWMFCMLPLQFTSLLPLAVGVYALTVCALSVALLAESDGHDS